MTLHSFHLAEVPRHVGLRALVRPTGGSTAGRDPRRRRAASASTISTFSVWRTVQEMEDMEHGRSTVPEPSRHTAAMAERERRDFHHEFATYRFRATSEHGSWDGRSDIVPGPVAR